MKKLLLVLASIFFVIILSESCKKNNDVDPDSNNPKIEQLVPASGGNIILPDLAQVTFEPNTFKSETSVSVNQIKLNKEVNDIYNDNANFIGVNGSLGYFINIRINNNYPKKSVKVEINLPDKFYNSIQSGYAFEALGLLNQSVDDEEILSFDVLTSNLNRTTKKLEVSLPNYYFDIKENGKYYDAVLTVVLLPGKNKDGRIAVDDCGLYIRCPLDVCTVTSSFNPLREHPTLKHPDGTPVIRPHRGADYRAPKNTSVYASYDGKIINSRWMNGYGNVVDIEHTNSVGQRFATRYAHLTESKVKVGDTVQEGDLVALSGNTGIGSAPHLHFEYFANGNTNSKNDNIDPVPLVNTKNIRLSSAQAKLTGANNCSSGSRSTWEVVFNFKDPSNKITPQSTLTFQDVEPVLNPPYTVSIGSLKTADGLVKSPSFCALFQNLTYFKIKVFMTLEDGSKSNCIYIILNKEGGAKRVTAQTSILERPSSNTN